MAKKEPLSANEKIKAKSHYLRGTIAEDLSKISTGSMSEENQQLLKFHGTYQQDNRDERANRRKKKLEKAYSFMIRIRVPGGYSTSKQWIAMDQMADQYGNGAMKLTTRQAFQQHGVIKHNLKLTMQNINKAAMDSIAACGDVNRNVMCHPYYYNTKINKELLKVSQEISDHLTPKTNAYHEIWLDSEKVVSTKKEIEPIYGKTYLPRKFKIAIAVPPHNDVDVYANDLGFVAIIKEEKLLGFNVLVGGGMGMTHGMSETFPRLADVIGFVPTSQVVEVAEKVVLVQRDHGNRENRKLSRLKYTIERLGLENFTTKLNKLLSKKLTPAKPFKFKSNSDNYGWIEDEKGNSYCTLFVEGGRLKNTEKLKMKTALKEIAQIHNGGFWLTGNQNVVINNVSKKQKRAVEKIINTYNLIPKVAHSELRLSSIACVSLPTCGLALTEAERFLPSVVTDLEKVMEEEGLSKQAITIRMTGCPNGCGRPFLGEIAFVGRSAGKYNIYLGASFVGDRLNKLYKVNVLADQLVLLLAPIIKDYAANKKAKESFGAFVLRKNYVKETKQGNQFHKNLSDKVAVLD